MTFYRYKAFGKEGALHKGTIEAKSSKELKNHLEKRGLSLISYSFQIPTIFSFFSRKIKARSLIDLCLHLEQFERAGIPLKESLEELIRVQENPKLKASLLEVLQDLEKGLLLSKALAKHSLVFDPVFVGLIIAGEKTGNLSFSFQQITQHLKWLDEMQAQTLKAFRYPIFMIIFLLSAVIVLMTVLVPELTSFMQSFKGDLPLATRCLISVSSFLSRYLAFLLGAVGSCGILMWAVFMYHPHGKHWKAYLQEKLPFLGPLTRKLALAQFCHLVAVMFGGGLDILHVLQTTRSCLGPGTLAASLKSIEEFVREGSSLSHALQKGGLFPPVVIRMVKMGEQTSTLPLNLLHVKEYFDTSVKRYVDHLIGLIEPFAMLSIGIIMAWIVYSIFIPLYETLALMDY